MRGLQRRLDRLEDAMPAEPGTIEPIRFFEITGAEARRRAALPGVGWQGERITYFNVLRPEIDDALDTR